MSLTSMITKLLPNRVPLEQRADRKRAGAEARRQIQIEKANARAVADQQNVHQRGNTAF